MLLISEEALQDVSGFEMIWVISHMHLNKGWNRQVRPPRLPEERKGLFSTRSPHRPNAVALSSLRVGRVDPAEGVIYVHGLDLLDGTWNRTCPKCAVLFDRQYVVYFTPVGGRHIQCKQLTACAAGVCFMPCDYHESQQKLCRKTE